jgi:hypothetical protein
MRHSSLRSDGIMVIISHGVPGGLPVLTATKVPWTLSRCAADERVSEQ